MQRQEKLVSLLDLTIFNAIYDAAKSNNKEQLKEMLKIGFYIDQKKDGLYTPCAQLAKEGNEEAVFLLIRLGARVHDAIFGYASGNLIDQANHCKQCFPYVDASLQEIKGYAIAGNMDLVNRMIKQETRKEERRLLEDAAIFGCAYSGRDVWNISILDYNGTSQVSAIAGGALAGHVDQVNQLIQKADGNKQRYLMDRAVQYYARGGYWAPMIELINRGAQMDAAISGLAYVGEAVYVLQSIRQITELQDDPDQSIRSSRKRIHSRRIFWRSKGSFGALNSD